MRAFEVILSRKDEVSYLQDLLSQREAAALLDKLRAFARWAEKTFRILQEGTR
jgi:cob(I)alamin adenosyltransferase